MRPEWLLYYENVSLLRELGSKPCSTSCGSSEPCRDIWELQAASFSSVTSGSCLCFWAAVSVLYCFNPNGKCRPLISTKNLVILLHHCSKASLMTQRVRNLPAMQKTWVQSLDRKEPLEKEMSTHSSILAWEVSWTEEPGEQQSMGSQRVKQD